MTILFFEKVRDTVRTKGDQVFATWYDKRGKAVEECTWNQAWEDAGTIAYYLRCEWGVKKGDRVVLCYLFGLHFFAAFLGCLRAGVLAVLVYPPGPPLVKSLAKLNNVIKDCKPVLILTDTIVSLVRTGDSLNPLSKSRTLWPAQVPYKVTDTLVKGRRGYLSIMPSFMTKTRQFHEEATVPDDVAFLQYTSGSTGEPKGVAIPFSSLWANVTLLGEDTHGKLQKVGGIPSPVTQFSWLPQYHDAGLICAYVLPFAYGWRQHFSSPLSFLENPLLWVDLLSKTRAHIGMAPDFAFRLVARKYQEAKAANGGVCPIPNLDLSCIRGLTNAAEPVRADTKDLFLEAFADHNLSENYFLAGYGLAESVVGVCFIHEFHLSAPRFEGENQLVACGCRQELHPTVTLKVVHPDTRMECEDGETGELWISGPSTRNFYYGKDDLTEQTYHGRIQNDVPSAKKYLRTGDLAFFQDDYLYICGRIKDLIIFNGVNYYPQDFEYVVQDASPLVRPGCVAAFSSNDVDGDGTVEVVFEIRMKGALEAAETCRKVHTSIAQTMGVTSSRVVAIKERTIPKTTSGKIQRRTTREKLHDNSLDVVYSFLPTSKELDPIHISPPKEFEDDLEQPSEDKEGAIFYEIIRDYFGKDVNIDATWEELGLSSMVSVQLRNDIANNVFVTLDTDCFLSHQSPRALNELISGLKGDAIPVTLPEIPQLESSKLSWFALSIAQVIGILCIFLIVAISIIPAYYVGSLAATENSVEIVEIDGRYMKWLWFPLAVPAWMFSLSGSIIFCKWLVVGKYQEGEIHFPSVAFLRWWWIDRLVHVWEQWVGIFFRGTIFLWLFYWLMGANIHPSVRVDKFFREFDLVQVGESAWLKCTGSIKCRMFGSGKLRFRRVHVGTGCVIGGMLSPGTNIGKHSHVEPRAVLREGSQAPESCTITGNPAVSKPGVERANHASWWKIYLLTTLWGIFSLYLGFAANLVAQIVLNGRLGDFRYTKLFYWVLIIFVSVLLFLPINVVMKWLLIGRRKPGKFQERAWQVACDWAIDLHFKIFYKIASIPWKSWWIFWNLTLKLYGSDVDFSTELGSPFSLVPSKVDLIHFKASYVSSAHVEFEPLSANRRSRIDVLGSNLGALSVIGPAAKLINTVVPPTEYVSRDMSGLQAQLPYRYSAFEHVTLIVLLVLWMCAIISSFIPAFEFATWAVSEFRMELAALSFALTLAIHTLTSCFILIAIERITFPSRTMTAPWNIPLFDVCLGATIAVTDHTFVPVLWGTPLWNMFARALGSTVGNRVLYVGAHVEGCPFHSIASDTVIDGAGIIGHNAVGDTYTLGDVTISGTVHEGTFLFAGTSTQSANSGPYRCMTLGAERSSHKPTNMVQPMGRGREDHHNDEVLIFEEVSV